MSKVLVVEDNKSLAKSLQDWLSRHYQVSHVATGHLAITEATQNDYDLIVLDLGLPDITGQEVCQAIRDKGVKAPILILTATDKVSSRVSLLDTGADDYLQKPFYQYLRGMGYGKKEQLRGLYLNSRYQVIHDEVISVGTLTSNIVHPREVFQPAIEHGAIAIIIGHNHPSGTLEPTNADIVVTERLLQAGKVLGIDILDHLVLAENKYVSVMECLRHDLRTEES